MISISKCFETKPSWFVVSCTYTFSHKHLSGKRSHTRTVLIGPPDWTTLLHPSWGDTPILSTMLQGDNGGLVAIPCPNIFHPNPWHPPSSHPDPPYCCLQHLLRLITGCHLEALARETVGETLNKVTGRRPAAKRETFKTNSRNQSQSNGSCENCILC